MLTVILIILGVAAVIFGAGTLIGFRVKHGFTYKSGMYEAMFKALAITFVSFAVGFGLILFAVR